MPPGAYPAGVKFLPVLLPLTCLAAAAPVPVTLPAFGVYSPRVANQDPVATFAAPVSALRFEPGVDLQSRNFAEAQADLTLRGGTFETAGVSVGAVSLLDPQTGHYLLELPVPPSMLGAPSLVSGPALAASSLNATSGAVTYGWRPVRAGGQVGAGWGPQATRRQEFQAGATRMTGAGGARLGAEIAWAHSESAGAVVDGDHGFDRVAGRLQRVSGLAQTDLFAGYQAKAFGWPNLYTPFNSPEAENLQTVLFALNHRIAGPGQDYAEFGAYHRRNKDDYAFNRRAPVGPVHPFQHTTWVSGAAAGGRASGTSAALAWRAEVLADEIHSTSLTFGRYRTRTLVKLALVPEWSFGAVPEATTVRAGVAYDDGNRHGGALGPVAEVSRNFSSGTWRRVSVGLSRTSQVPGYTALNASAASGLFRGNPNLGRSRADEIQAALEGRWSEWDVRAEVFHRQDDALVDWTFRRGVTARLARPVDVSTSGAGLLARRSWGRSDVVLGYTGLTKRPDYRGEVVDGSFYALNYARHRLTAAATLRLGGGWEVRSDHVLRLQADNPLRVVGGRQAWQAALGLAWRPPAWRGPEFSVSVENLGQSRFQEVPAVPAAPRQWVAGVRHAW